MTDEAVVDDLLEHHVGFAAARVDGAVATRTTPRQVREPARVLVAGLVAAVDLADAACSRSRPSSPAKPLVEDQHVAAHVRPRPRRRPAVRQLERQEDGRCSARRARRGPSTGAPERVARRATTRLRRVVDGHRRLVEEGEREEAADLVEARASPGRGRRPSGSSRRSGAERERFERRERHGHLLAGHAPAR